MKEGDYITVEDIGTAERLVALRKALKDYSDVKVTNELALPEGIQVSVNVNVAVYNQTLIYSCKGLVINKRLRSYSEVMSGLTGLPESEFIVKNEQEEVCEEETSVSIQLGDYFSAPSREDWDTLSDALYLLNHEREKKGLVKLDFSFADQWGELQYLFPTQELAEHLLVKKCL